MKRQINNGSAIQRIVWILGVAACTPTAPSTPDDSRADAGVALADAADRVDSGSIEMDAADIDAGELDASPTDTGCPIYSHPGNSGCETTLTWQELPTGPPSRDHHVTFLKGNADSATLYVSGGLDEHARLVRNDLWYANLGTDGELTTWSRGPNPPMPQMGAAVAVSGSRAYLVAGKTLMGSRSVESAAVNSVGLGADGTPETWRAERPLPAPRFHGSAEPVDRFIFAIGGIELQPGLGSPNVWRAEILADGALSDWIEVTPLPEGRSHHSSFVHGHTLYVLGGLDGSGVGFPSQTFSDYLKASIDAEGDLSAWTRVALPFGTSTQSSIVLGDRVVLFGGFDDSLTILDTARAAPIVEGELGAWQTLSPLLYPRAHVHHTPSWGGRVYSFGGNVGNHVAVNRVIGGVFD